MAGVAVAGLRLGRPDAARRLSDAALSAGPGEFVVVIGASGSGKSTLLAALSGLLRVDAGEGSVAGVAVREPAVRRAGRVGYVPSEQALHPELTVTEELELAARLRGVGRDGSGDVPAQVAGLLHVLGIAATAPRRIRELSQGEAKRVSVAVELIARPRVLLLDEATTGLDPGHEHHLVGYLRTLADQGCCVVLVTHSVMHLAAADRLVHLGTGGRVLAAGAPADVLAAAGASNFVELFDRDDVYLPVRGEPAPPEDEPSVPVVPGRVALLALRDLRRLLGDRRTLGFLALQAPVLGLIVRLLAGHDGLGIGAVSTNLVARRMLLTLVVAAVWLGSTNTIRSVVADRAVLRRERVAGVRAGQVLAAKLIVLTALNGAQVVVLTAVALAGQGFGYRSPVLRAPLLAVTVVLWACAMAAASFALAISAFVRSTDQALAILPLLLVPQLVLSGGVLALSDVPALQAVAQLTPARWGLAGLASSVNLRALESHTQVPVPLDSSELHVQRHEDADAAWDPSPAAWSLDLGMLVLLSAAGCGAAGIGLRRT